MAVLSAVDLVMDTTAMARLHSDLAKRFVPLERELVLAGKPTEDLVRQFTARRLEIEIEEPPVLRTLDRLCHNELARAMGHPDSEFVRIPWYERPLAHFISFEPPRQRNVQQADIEDRNSPAKSGEGSG